jgi:hypothetical protein
MMTGADCPRVTDLACSIRDRIFVSACAPGGGGDTGAVQPGGKGGKGGSLLCWDIKTAKVHMGY